MAGTLDEEIERLVSTYVRSQRDWYRGNQFWPMFLYRASGLLLILLGIMIPLLSQLSDETLWLHKDLIISIVGLAITAITSVVTFMGWETTWRGRRLALTDLDTAIAAWDVELTKARHLANAAQEDMAKRKIRATKELIERAYGTTRAETEKFFSELKAREKDEGDS